MAERGGKHTPGRGESICKRYVVRGKSDQNETLRELNCMEHREEGVCFREEARKWVEIRLGQGIKPHYSSIFLLRATKTVTWYGRDAVSFCDPGRDWAQGNCLGGWTIVSLPDWVGGSQDGNDTLFERCL